MGKKLPSLGPKHLETSAKKFRTIQGEMDLCSLLDFLLLRESPSPSSAPAPSPQSALPGLKSFAAIWSCLNPGEKLGFFHKWLYRVEKTNMSVHRRSHKTSESAAAYAQICTSPLSRRLTRYKTL